jgi:hypothetical protein
MRRAPAWPVALALACLAPATSGVEAQEPPAGQEAAVEEKADTLGWHVVREGETLEGITEYYLGASRPWPENWQLIPDVEDPHLLHPGQRLRVIIERRLPPRSAQVTKIGRRVDDKFHPYDWQKATIGDLLKQQDAVRTHRRSSAELRFDNDTRLLVTEDSVVFLRAVESTVTGVQRESIEILEGQADIETVPTRPGTHEVEILVGEVTAKPKSGATEVGQARARQASGGGAQLMVFKGESEVEAAGAVVSVPKGMGTSVAEGAPPSPPEKLLPAPQVRSPKAGSSWDYANPPFSWQEVAEARSYVVEVCADRDCGKLVERATGLADTSWVPDALEASDLYWRVTAVSASGLDGSPSKAIAFRINSGRSAAADARTWAVVARWRWRPRTTPRVLPRCSTAGTAANGVPGRARSWNPPTIPISISWSCRPRIASAGGRASSRSRCSATRALHGRPMSSSTESDGRLHRPWPSETSCRVCGPAC